MTQNRKALVFALLAVALWSTVASGFKLGLREMDPVQLLWLGTAVSTAFFVTLQTWRGWHMPTRSTWLWALGLGALNPTIYYLILFEAYARLPAQVAQPLNYTWAIVLALMAVPILGQRLSRRALLGIVVSYSGVVILLTQGAAIEPEGLDPIGIVLALASTIVWASYLLLNTRTSGDLMILSLSFLLALPVLSLICALTSGFPTLSPSHLGFGLWVGLVEMGITFLLWQQALKRTTNAALVGQLIFLSPFLSLLLIETLVGETIALASWISLGIIVTGLLISGPPAQATDEITASGDHG